MSSVQSAAAAAAAALAAAWTGLRLYQWRLSGRLNVLPNLPMRQRLPDGPLGAPFGTGIPGLVPEEVRRGGPLVFGPCIV